MDVESKREREKKTVDRMIRIYCHGVHGTKHGLCKECSELSKYAHMRSDHCPFMETKTFCSNCKVHCCELLRLIEVGASRKLLTSL